MPGHGGSIRFLRHFHASQLPHAHTALPPCGGRTGGLHRRRAGRRTQRIRHLGPRAATAGALRRLADAGVRAACVFRMDRARPPPCGGPHPGALRAGVRLAARLRGVDRGSRLAPRVGLSDRLGALPRRLGFRQPEVARQVGGERCGPGLDPLLGNLHPDGGKRVVRHPRAPGPHQEVRVPPGGRPRALLRAGDRRDRRLGLRDRVEHGRLAQALRRGLSRARVSRTRVLRRDSAGDFH